MSTSNDLQERLAELEAELVQMRDLLRGIGANRYWEARWRDEAHENDVLRRRLAVVVARLGEVMTEEQLAALIAALA